MMQTRLLEHPAVRAWNNLHLGQVEPNRIMILGDKRRSKVYELEGAGPKGTKIVAKLASLATTDMERIVYEQVLPRLPIPCVNYYGFIEDDDGESGWLFLGFADGREYSPAVKEYRVLAANWLGLLHTFSTYIPAAARLPNREPDHYLKHLQSARRKIIQNFANPALDAGDRQVLKKTIYQCDRLETHWSRLKKDCAEMPQTLIHGDFAPKNMRVQIGKEGIALQVFDWEHAGWGSPAADLVQSAKPSERFWCSPDLDVYYSAVRQSWPDFDVDILQSLANIGKIFRLLVWINGDAESLKTQWVESTITKLQIYQNLITDALSYT